MSRGVSYVASAWRAGLLLTLIAVAIFPVVCTSVSAARNTPRTFASPAEAGQALYQATKSGDKAALLSIFGPDGQQALFTGDAVIDQTALNDFGVAYDRMHRWGNIQAGGKLLYVGAENFPFPIPLVQDASGRWYFDTASGQDEILARTIGRNELVAIAALQSLATAERQHTPSPLAQMGDFAKASGQTEPGEKSQPFSGYYFRTLTKPGGFTILAYPAEYRDTGIMSFIIGEDGIVYQKDLGERTAEVAAGITADNRGEGWTPVNTR
jgi:hypothetical protein